MYNDDKMTGDDFGLSELKMDGVVANNLSTEVLCDASRLMNTPGGYGMI
jgi:hypothetical protein